MTDQISNVGDKYANKVENFSWELCKENIQPISQGRKIDTLMKSLRLVNDNKARQQLVEARRQQFDEDLETNKDDLDRQLDLWHDYIDWLEQNTPDGGKVNGITNAIEKCIEFYHDKKQFKQDKRIFSIFMKFKRFCDEPAEVFGFMYANSICTLLARFYLNWSWQYEIRNNLKRAEDLIKLGIKNLASPRDVLIEAQSQLKCRIERMLRAGELDNIVDCSTTTISYDNNNPLATIRESQVAGGEASGIRAALQTLKFKATKRKGAKVAVKRIGNAVDQTNVGGLKSLNKVVNGVVVPKKTSTAKTVSTPSSRSSSKPPNKPIKIFNEAAQATESTSSGGSQGLSSSSVPLDKIPTSQRIQSVGRRGAENQAAKHCGSLSAAGIKASALQPKPILKQQQRL